MFDEPFHEVQSRAEFRQLQIFIGLVGLGDIARPADNDRIARLLEMPAFGSVADDVAAIVARQPPRKCLGRAWATAQRLRSGNVGINSLQRNHEAPFGGFKQSGVGRDGGSFGLHAYSEMQSIIWPG